MKRLIMCEGPNELGIIRLLLKNDKLIFGEDDLIGLEPYHARQIVSNGQVRTQLNMYPGNDVLIMRIGDVQNETLKIPEDYREKIIKVEKYCTKPELEMLLIISEGLVTEFEKQKSSVSPKDFAKKHIRCGRRKYDNSTQFYLDYYGTDPDALVDAIKEYKRIKGAHKKDELYLADLLK